MTDFPCIFKTTVNFPLSVWPSTSFQIVSYLRPSSVENFGYDPGSLKPDMLVKVVFFNSVVRQCKPDYELG